MVRQCSLCAIVLILALVVGAGCGSTATGPSVTIATAGLVVPTVGTSYRFKDQPITLTTRNGVSTGKGPLTYVFEIASDSAFATKVYTSARGPEGSSGLTSAKVDKTLDGAKTYYWRVQTFDGDTGGPYSSALTFSVKGPVTIGIPVLVSPANGGTTGNIAHLVVNNSVTINAVGQVSYNYQIARNATFTDKVESGFATEEAGGQTGWDGKIDLGSGNTLYWRVSATDGDGNASDYSTAWSFKTITFDATKAIFIKNPPLNTWAETARITRIDFSSGNVVVDFDRRDGPDRWPDVPFGSGNLEYTLGMCGNFSGQWHCSAVIQFWYGRDLEAGGRMDEIGINWYYDRWGILNGWQPQIGEVVGIFVGAGNLRDSTNWKVEERSNIVILPYGTNYNRQ